MPAADPFANIPDADDEYAGTPLETSAERDRRLAVNQSPRPRVISPAIPQREKAGP